MKGSAVWSSKFFGLNFPYWELWLTLLVGMAVGGVSLLALKFLSPRRRPNGPPPGKPKPDMPVGDPFTQGSATEQRRALRRGGNPVEVLLTSLQEESAPWRGWVLDRSVGGLCLGVDREIQPGTLLRIRPVHAPECTYWLEIEVRSCRALQSEYEIGCRFVKTPPWSVLLLFG